MARLINQRDQTPILDAAQKWIRGSLIQNRSVFSNQDLWSVPVVGEVTMAFIDHFDEGKGKFLPRLQQQLASTSPQAKQLAAEMVWALLLFPSRIKPAIKRAHIGDVWEWSGTQLDMTHELLTDDVLVGIGSGGPGFNNYRHRELAFLMRCAASLKTNPETERESILTDYDRFLAWIDTVKEDGKRQFRNMLRYFLFPDRVERMSSANQRRKVLQAFGSAGQANLNKWSDRQLDDALLDLRKSLEQRYPGQILDFYERPLKEQWQPRDEGEDDDDDDGKPASRRSSANGAASQKDGDATTEPVNIIVYGPPGTGKTHWLRQQHARYTDAPSVVDLETWRQELVGQHGWRAVIVAAMSDIGRPTRVPDLRAHPLIQAKAKQRGRTSQIQATIWNYLQEHTPEHVETVKLAARRPPFVFSKSKSGDWELLKDWRTADEEANGLAAQFKKGPSGAAEPVKRYRTITFHPSFGYEDFIRGIRPVEVEGTEATQFRMIDGVFKRICDLAKANPGKRYACFIDEINRANIAKVFGELITLIEIDKRARFDASGKLIDGMVVDLPGGVTDDGLEPPFGVPVNLDIYGTMNTADRSIALLDIALRRRFQFQEMEPRYELLEDVGGIDLGKMLEVINDRLEYLLDRDHRIGHAYFMSVETLDDLRMTFADRIVPLIQEYFFDGFSKVAAVLTTTGSVPFVRAEAMARADLFGMTSQHGVPAEVKRYRVTKSSGWTAETFRGLYESSIMPSSATTS